MGFQFYVESEKQKPNRLLHAEDKLVVVQGKMGRRMGKIDKGEIFSVTKYMSYRNVKYSLGNMVNNTVPMQCGDRW